VEHTAVTRHNIGHDDCIMTHLHPASVIQSASLIVYSHSTISWNVITSSSVMELTLMTPDSGFA